MLPLTLTPPILRLHAMQSLYMESQLHSTHAANARLFRSIFCHFFMLFAVFRQPALSAHHHDPCFITTSFTYPQTKAHPHKQWTSFACERVVTVYIIQIAVFFSFLIRARRRWRRRELYAPPNNRAKWFFRFSTKLHINVVVQFF